MAIHHLVLLSSLVIGGNETKALPSANEIVQSALDRAEQMDHQRLETSYTFCVLVRSEKLSKDGTPKKIETRRFQNVPYPERSYTRLIEIDGRPLDPKEMRKEQKREREFVEKLKKGNLPDRTEEDRVPFDEELVRRYRFELIGLEQIGASSSYAIAFRPKDKKLPVQRRIDRALNKSTGTVWIDRDTFAIARLDFELMEKIRLWWGVIGSISRMRGSLVFKPIDEDAWMPSHFEFYINARILIRSLHQNQILSWSDFEKVSPLELDAAPD
jgi:hypothetical protein